jgi:hypothetical protein
MFPGGLDVGFGTVDGNDRFHSKPGQAGERLISFGETTGKDISCDGEQVVQDPELRCFHSGREGRRSI